MLILKRNIENCVKKLDRAKELTNLLSDENKRWNVEIKLLE